MTIRRLYLFLLCSTNVERVSLDLELRTGRIVEWMDDKCARHVSYILRKENQLGICVKQLAFWFGMWDSNSNNGMNEPLDLSI